MDRLRESLTKWFSNKTEGPRSIPRWLQPWRSSSPRSLGCWALGDPNHWRKKVNFLLDTGATYSVLSNAGLPHSHSVTVRGGSGKLVTRQFSQPLCCNRGDFFFSHDFLIMPESPTPPLGPEILAQLGATIYIAPEQVLCLPLIETEKYGYARKGGTGHTSQGPNVLSSPEAVAPEAWG